MIWLILKKCDFLGTFSHNPCNESCFCFCLFKFLNSQRRKHYSVKLSIVVVFPPEKDVKKTFVDAWMDLFFLLLSLAILLTLDLFYPHFYGTIWPKFKGESTFVTYIPYKWNFVHNARKPKKIEEHSIWKLSKMSYLWTSTPILIYFFVCIAIFSNTYLNFRAKMGNISPSYGNLEFWR